MLPVAFSPAYIGASLFKGIRYAIDCLFRDRVQPVPGSVVYCDLFYAVEHSGIYVGEDEISNIEVEGFAEGAVRLTGPDGFTSKSVLGPMIYVSCGRCGAVGNNLTSQEAEASVGERSFYGLVIKNCHQFSSRCVMKAERRSDELEAADYISGSFSSMALEPTFAFLKRAARDHLGATKWRLWDWKNKGDSPSIPEPDWDAISERIRGTPLNATSIEQIRFDLAEVDAYETEISDEIIPDTIRQRLKQFRQTLKDISSKYEEAKPFIVACHDASISYDDLRAIGDELAPLAMEMAKNENILSLVRKLGRNYISEELKKRTRLSEAARNEVYGIHRSDDIMRLLPVELVNFEDETLEILFYARLLEKNLLTYELAGITHRAGEAGEVRQNRTGPVVACLDTSGSMQGVPILKAKALLLAVGNILKREGRSLHVVLFGASGQLRELRMDSENNAAGLLAFLRQGFGGGTDFETPLQRAVDIIESQEQLLKADILMISDGDCSLSEGFMGKLTAKKSNLDFCVYSVLCAGLRVEDRFSDEVLIL